MSNEHTQTHTNTHTQTHTNTQTQTHTNTHKHTNTNTHKHKNANTHKHKNTNTHIPHASAFRPLPLIRYRSPVARIEGRNSKGLTQRRKSGCDHKKRTNSSKNLIHELNISPTLLSGFTSKHTHTHTHATRRRGERCKRRKGDVSDKEYPARWYLRFATVTVCACACGGGD